MSESKGWSCYMIERARWSYTEARGRFNLRSPKDVGGPPSPPRLSWTPLR
jgi:hypothetical protein